MTASSMNCTASVYHVWVRAVVGPALRRAQAVWIGTSIVAAVCFGGTGMHARDLTQLALHIPGVAAVLGLIWLLVFAPTARVLVRADEARYLRALPHGPTWPIAAVALAALQLPWLVLWVVGEGWCGLAIVAGLTVPIAVVGAWRPRWRHARTPRWSGGRRALAAVYVRAVVRKGGDALLRGVGLSLLAGLTGALFVRNNGFTGTHAAVLATAVIIVVITPATLGALLPLAEAHRHAADLVASLAVAPRVPLATVVAGIYGLAAGIASAVAVAATGNAWIALFAVSTAAAAALMIVPALARPPVNIVVRAIVAAAVTLIWLAWLGATGAALAVVTGFVAVMA
jgi:hypothetical protein